MSKYDELSQKVKEYLDGFMLNEIEEYIISNSNLPGQRANLELSYAFADYFEGKSVDPKLWELLCRWSSLDSGEAPTNNPKEFLPFCAAQALGSQYLYVDDLKRRYILDTLKKAMNDDRWRMREGVAMAFQRIAEKDFGVVETLFTEMYPSSGFLEKRAFIAALAHPPILGEKSNVLFCLKISEDILNEIIPLSQSQLKSEEFGVLSKGLEYAISVFVENLPEEGFALMRKFAAADHKSIKKILKSNLGKARLKKKYGDTVDEILGMVEK